jgi:hypothetical protein
MSTTPTATSMRSSIASTVRERQRRFRRHVLPTVAIVTASLAVGASSASAAPGGRPDDVVTERNDNRCLTPSGVDLNELYGVSAQIISSVCTQVGAGEHWTVSAVWFMAPTFAVVPAGFVPAGVTPLEDFLAKFVAVKYVIDPGTSQEQTYQFLNNGNVGTSTTADGLPIVNSLTVGVLIPRSVGEHMVAVYWVFSSMHCDGLGDVIGPFPNGNCLQAGEHRLGTLHFTVTPGEAGG